MAGQNDTRGEPEIADLLPVEADPAPRRPAAPDRPRHSPLHLSLAEEFGIPRETAERLTPDQLEHRIEGARHAARQYERAFREDQDRRRQQQPAPQPPAAPRYDFGEYTDEDGKKRRVELDGLDPAVRQIIETLAGKYEEVRDTLRQSEEREKGRAVRERLSVIDTAFEMVSDDFGEFYGEGTLDSLRKGGNKREIARRSWVLEEIGVDYEALPGAKQLAKQIRNVTGQFRGSRAANQAAEPAGDAGYAEVARGRAPRDGEFVPAAPPVPPPAPPRQAAPPKDPVSGRFVRRDEQWPSQDEWDAAALAQPTARRHAEPPPSRDKAVKGVEEQLREWGRQDAEAAPNPNGQAGFQI